MDNKEKIIKLIREEYSNRLLQLFQESVKELVETEIFDAQGNQLLSPGLKVRHKKSGYEYTVDHVEGEKEETFIFLRHPETARFNPPDQQTQLSEQDDDHRIKVDDVNLSKVMGDPDTEIQSFPQDTAVEMQNSRMNQVDIGSLLKVSKKDFEKEYEVK